MLIFSQWKNHLRRQWRNHVAKVPPCIVNPLFVASFNKERREWAMSALHIRAVCCHTKRKRESCGKTGSWQLQSGADPPIAFFFTNNAWGASAKALRDTTTRPSWTLGRVTVSRKVNMSLPRRCERWAHEGRKDSKSVSTRKSVIDEHYSECGRKAGLWSSLTSIFFFHIVSLVSAWLAFNSNQQCAAAHKRLIYTRRCWRFRTFVHKLVCFRLVRIVSALAA